VSQAGGVRQVRQADGGSQIKVNSDRVVCHMKLLTGAHDPSWACTYGAVHYIAYRLQHPPGTASPPSDEGSRAQLNRGCSCAGRARGCTWLSASGQEGRAAAAEDFTAGRAARGSWGSCCECRPAAAAALAEADEGAASVAAAVPEGAKTQRKSGEASRLCTPAGRERVGEERTMLSLPAQAGNQRAGKESS
jgi:hypothetical protein